MDTRKASVTLNCNDIHTGYMFADEEIPVAFSSEEVPSVMEELGLPYAFQDSERTSPFSSRVEMVSELVIEPDTEDVRIIEPISVSDGNWRNFDVYPIDAQALVGRQWMLSCDGGDTLDVLSYAESAAKDIHDHVSEIVEQYSVGIGEMGANMRDAFYQSLSYLLARPEHIDDIPEFVESQRYRALEGYVFCEGCGELVPEMGFHEVKRTETNIEQTYTDAGYGDDDTFGEVTRHNTYRVCDRCGHEVKIDSMYISTRNEKSRWQLRSEC